MMVFIPQILLDNPQRVQIGEDKKYDWVEVGCILDDKLNPRYCDHSKIIFIRPIIEKSAQENGGNYFIEKENSIWILHIDKDADKNSLGLFKFRNNGLGDWNNAIMPAVK